MKESTKKYQKECEEYRDTSERYYKSVIEPLLKEADVEIQRVDREIEELNRKLDSIKLFDYKDMHNYDFLAKVASVIESGEAENARSAYALIMSKAFLEIEARYGIKK